MGELLFGVVADTAFVVFDARVHRHVDGVRDRHVVVRIDVRHGLLLELFGDQRVQLVVFVVS